MFAKQTAAQNHASHGLCEIDPLLSAGCVYVVRSLLVRDLSYNPEANSMVLAIDFHLDSPSLHDNAVPPLGCAQARQECHFLALDALLALRVLELLWMVGDVLHAPRPCSTAHAAARQFSKSELKSVIHTDDFESSRNLLHADRRFPTG